MAAASVLPSPVIVPQASQAMGYRPAIDFRAMVFHLFRGLIMPTAFAHAKRVPVFRKLLVGCHGPSFSFPVGVARLVTIGVDPHV